ncbi:hypothetical protein AB1046_05410 [Promicromonospora sp. Populi]|uniref:hypothetical protein n=1 Tax=Promicromonospora sp. Populi TaxID=3239420 RepID=UPI0034E19B83
MTTIDVTDHGAVPDSGHDTADALRAALAAVRAAGPGTQLLLPPGRYDVWPERAEKRELYVTNTVGADPDYRIKTIGLLVEGVTDLEIVADGATLMLHGKQTALAIIDSRHVTVRGLEVDWAVPTVIDVTVEDAGVEDTGVDGAGVEGGRAWRLLSVPATNPFEVDGTHVEWQSDPSPVDGLPYWSGQDGLQYSQVYDPRTRRTRRDHCPVFDDVDSIERVDERRFRVTYRTAEAPSDRGIVYQLRDIERDHPGMLVLDSADVTFEDLRIRYLHGFGLVGQNSEDLVINRTVFRPPAGTGRVTGGFADFVNTSGMSGRVTITDCEFDGPHDDPINIHGAYLAVAGSPEADRLALEYRHDQTAGFPQYAPGDRIELVRRDTMETVFEDVVVEVDGPTGRDHDHALDRMVVRLGSELPAAVRALAETEELGAENTTRTPEVTITDCTFRNVPTRAILVTTRQPVRIERCTFDGITMPVIQIAGDTTFWWESGPVRDVLIADNTFSGVTAGVLQIVPGTIPNAPPVHGTVRLERNVIELEEPLLAELYGVRQVEARSNTLRWKGAAPEPAAVVIESEATVGLDWPTTADEPRIDVVLRQA